MLRQIINAAYPARGGNAARGSHPGETDFPVLKISLQLKRHDFEPPLNCQRTKLQNSSWEYLAENSLSNLFIII